MEILNIHTCRTEPLLHDARMISIDCNITRYQHSENYLKHVEDVIKSNTSADIYVMEISSLKYERGSPNYDITEYENYLCNIFDLLNNKPVFILFNLNPVMSNEHITPEMKSKLDENNRIGSRNRTEKWTKQFLKKHYKGKFKAITGDDIFGKYNESKYIMNMKDGKLDVQHYTTTRSNFSETDKPIPPRRWAIQVARRHLNDFILNECNV